MLRRLWYWRNAGREGLPMPNFSESIVVQSLRERTGMKRRSTVASLGGCLCGLALLVWAPGCARSLSETDRTLAKRNARELSPTGAATVASRLANDECYRLYNKRPFKPEQYRVVREGEVYRWG